MDHCPYRTEVDSTVGDTRIPAARRFYA